MEEGDLGGETEWRWRNKGTRHQDSSNVNWIECCADAAGNELPQISLLYGDDDDDGIEHKQEDHPLPRLDLYLTSFFFKSI
jgi:hypothetical protein